MQTVNYYVLGELFSLLERIELIDNIEFCQFDPDNEDDIAIIAEKYIKPTVKQASHHSQDAIQLALQYYTTIGAAPLQEMRDDCQDLSLPDPHSWITFFAHVHRTIFGEERSLQLDHSQIVEKPDQEECLTLFKKE